MLNPIEQLEALAKGASTQDKIVAYWAIRDIKEAPSWPPWVVENVSNRWRGYLENPRSEVEKEMLKIVVDSI